MEINILLSSSYCVNNEFFGAALVCLLFGLKNINLKYTHIDL
jgi:hypothetical protein